jgi:hypothetical protein
VFAARALSACPGGVGNPYERGVLTLSTSSQLERQDRLEYREEPVKLTRTEWAADCRLGLVQRIAGHRYVLRLDRLRGVRTLNPVILVEDH